MCAGYRPRPAANARLRRDVQGECRVGSSSRRLSIGVHGSAFTISERWGPAPCPSVSRQRPHAHGRPREERS
jgi:hypothetical protein